MASFLEGITVTRQTAEGKSDVQRDAESCCMDSPVLLRSGEIREHLVGGWVKEASGRQDWTPSTGERTSNTDRGMGRREEEMV